MQYNPYDLVPLLINGKEMSGRPFEFDTQVADQKTMLNAFGGYVKPTKISTCCPDCGGGMMIDVVMDDPPFDPVVINCQTCYPDLPAVADPFVNPLLSERIKGHELDPLLHNPDEQIKTDESTVKERMEALQQDETGHSTQSVLVKDEETTEEASGEQENQEAVNGPEASGEQKETPPVVTPEETKQEETKPEPKSKKSKKPAKISDDHDEVVTSGATGKFDLRRNETTAVTDEIDKELENLLEDLEEDDK